MGLYIAMNTLMPLPRTPLAPRPMLAEEPVLMASTRRALCHGAAVDFDQALTVCTSCTDCLFWDVFFPLLGLSESAYKATLPSSSSSSSSLHA